MKMNVISVVLCFWVVLGQADERLWVDARINGQKARLIFDTGADRLLLFRKGADRLRLRITNAQAGLLPPPGAVVLGATEPCDVSVLGSALKTSLGVVEIPSYVDMQADGVFGWGPVQKSVLRIDAISSEVDFLEDAPKQASAWTKLRVRTDSGYLSLEIPHENDSTGVVLVDTGFTGGVAVPPQTWKTWKAAHSDEPTTLDSYFMPGAGLVAKEETWAHAINLGPLVLTEVPLTEANQAQEALGSVGYEASLGLAALKRLDFIVDGKGGVAYLRLKTTPPPPYEHNRLGAVFVPADSHNDNLVAKVTSGSPAHEAGICNGDVLLKIGKLDATKWRSDPAILPLSRFWMKPADTKLDLTLERANGTFKATVLLREILTPRSASPQKPNERS
jgi:hypothetical protein